MTFEELYHKVIAAKAKDMPLDLKEGSYEKNHLDCLLHPKEHPLIVRRKECDCTDSACVSACIFHAMRVENGHVTLDPALCSGCSECIKACDADNLTFSKDAVTAVELLKDTAHPVYALMAPAFLGQFGEAVTPARLRSALKQIGFAGMLEVAAFADILTLKEALEFADHADVPGSFQLTSCCCPVWIGMIRRDFSKIVSHLPASVSPMIACGRIAKALHPDCTTVFVGPCMAKKAEARDKELAGAIDCVLTYEELNDLLHVFVVDLTQAPEEVREHSATAGRLYGRTGGVSKAVGDCVKSIQPDCNFSPVTANGVADCKKLLADILDGRADGNFFEGMACDGGCAGGPKRILSTEACTRLINDYAKASPFHTPVENPYVADLIGRLGFSSVEDFVENSAILARSL